MNKQCILSAIGGNRPGVVAEISEAVYRAGCNIENSNMTMLGNYFTLMIHIKAADDEVLQDLARRCDNLQQKKDIKLNLFLEEPAEQEADKREFSQTHYEIRARGKDRAGIIYRTSNLLASMNINILEMSTSVDRDSKRGYPLFTMRILIQVPKKISEESLRNDLGALAEDLEESISLVRYNL